MWTIGAIPDENFIIQRMMKIFLGKHLRKMLKRKNEGDADSDEEAQTDCSLHAEMTLEVKERV